MGSTPFLCFAFLRRLLAPAGAGTKSVANAVVCQSTVVFGTKEAISFGGKQ